MGTDPLLIFHPLTLFLVLSVLWVFGGPILAVLLSFVVSNVTTDFLMHPTIRVFAVPSHADRANDPSDRNMQYVIRENFIEMCRGIFLIYAALGLIVVPTFILIFMAEIRQPNEPPAMGLFLTSLLNLGIVGGVVIGSHTLAVIMRDRIWDRVTTSIAEKNERASQQAASRTSPAKPS